MTPRLMLLMILFVSACATPKPDNGCKDFLQEMGKKPAGLVFEGCAPGNKHQLKALVATYSVEGSKAKDVEQSFIAHFKLDPLKFACCGWDGRPTSFKGPNGDEYDLQMHSGETLEKDWKKIKTFQVVVYKLLELP